MINISNLRKAFNEKNVLNGLNLKIKPGERVALLGQNGSGKTTFIRCLLGLYNFEGVINIDGQVLLENRKTVLKKIAFVPQLPPPLKNSIREIIDLNNKLSGVEPRAILRISNELGLDLLKNQDQIFKNLSGGMKQKFLISCALARESQILIFDEPASNLDPTARQTFFKLLKQTSLNTTILLSSHRVDEISDFVTRIIEFDLGTVIMDKGNDILRG